MVVLRRLDALLEETKGDVMKELTFQREEIGITSWGDLDALPEHLDCTKEALPDYGWYPDENPDEYIVYESESSLRDYEQVPLKDNIYDYFLREVKPHGQGSIFLNLFFKSLDIREFNEPNNNAVVKTEYPIQTGRIDIYLEYGSEKIFIENKIKAGISKAQLRKYSKFTDHLILLTLQNMEEEEVNKHEVIENNKVDEKDNPPTFCHIYYDNEIINWLEDCKKEAASIPILRETITQYINLIKKLTGQNINKKMSQYIAERITKDKESFVAFKKMDDAKDDMFF